MTFKQEILAICNQVVADFPDWKCNARGDFVCKSVKHSVLSISPGLFFTSPTPSCSTQPFISLENKQARKLSKHLFDFDYSMFNLNYYWIWRKYRTEGVSGFVSDIFPQGPRFNDEKGELIWRESWIVIDQAEEYFRRVLQDGLMLMDDYFSLGSEEDLLRNLPVGFDREIPNVDLTGILLEGGWGVTHCLMALCVGNFEFVEKYLNDEIPTLSQKRWDLLEIIRQRLPELKQQFAEQGKIII